MLSNEKIKHCVEVARLCYELAKNKYELSERACRVMWFMGYNHDIGYEFMDEDSSSSEHPRIAHDILVDAFGADVQGTILLHGKVASQDNIALRILNEADLQVDRFGNRISVEKRLEDIELRYGVDSRQYQQSLYLAKELGLVGEDF